MSTSSHSLKFVLPQELIDKVVDEADFQSLKTLGLVSKQWCPRTRELLFKDINLSEKLDHPLDPATRCERLLELLEAKSELRRLPRTLLIRSSTFDDEDWSLGWLQVCSDDVIKILGMLQNVNVVALREGRMRLDFCHLPLSLRAALYSFISRRNVIELTLIGVRCMEMTPLVQHPSLQKLRLAFNHPLPAELEPFPALKVGVKQWSTSEAASLSSREDSAPPKKFLRHLDVTRAGSTLYLLVAASQNPQATLDFTRIEWLKVGTLGFNTAMTRVWPHFLETFCQNVSRYSVMRGPARPKPEHLLDGTLTFNPSLLPLAHLPNLERLRVDVPHYYLLTPGYSLFPYLLEALAELSASRKPVPLSVLEIGIAFEGPPAGFEYEGIPHTVADLLRCEEIWERLDEILSDRQVFSQFKTVIVRMGRDARFTSPLSAKERKEMKDDIRSYMPNLVEQSKVKVVFRVPAGTSSAAPATRKLKSCRFYDALT
ncbi:hypothetical protein EST38_g3436 [Candolleomyces aberdarensis]|uniref:F-box domain-containing protein n=1 Tax=Candolleomyces aberdarensis TaxID=2316362 RepID=A0A4V1Q4K8_9AGAR|nr:hypothetical protein EST38_g3436 [Candolleomyces aberdarensis]